MQLLFDEYIEILKSEGVNKFKNLPYYFKFEEQSGDVHEIVFKNGLEMKGVVLEETEDRIRLNTDGAIMTYKRSDIKSVKSSSKIWSISL